MGKGAKYLGLSFLLERHSLMSRVEIMMEGGSISLAGISVTLPTVYCPLEMVVSCVPDPLALLEPVTDGTSDGSMQPQEQRGLKAEYTLK